MILSALEVSPLDHYRKYISELIWKNNNKIRSLIVISILDILWINDKSWNYYNITLFPSGGGPLTSEEEVQIIGGGDVTEAEISHLKESIVHIKKLVLKTSQQFNLQHQDILKRAVEKHKGEQARVMACNKQIKSLLAAPLQNQLNPHHQQQQQQQVQPQMLQHPQQPQPVILASAAPPGLIQISAAGPLPQVPSPVIASPTSVLMPRLPTVPVARLPASQQPVQPPRQATSADEQRMLRYGKAILKLKHYR